MNPLFVNILSVSDSAKFQKELKGKVEEAGLEINLLRVSTSRRMTEFINQYAPRLILIAIPFIKGELANTEEYVGGVIEDLKLQFPRGENAIVPIYSGDCCPIEFQVGQLQWKHDPDIIVAELKKLGFGPLDR